MKTGGKVILFLAIALASSAVWMAYTKAPRQKDLHAVNDQIKATSVPVERSGNSIQQLVPSEIIRADTSAEPPVILTEAPTPSTLARTQQVAQVPKPGKKKVIQDPVARDALALVGMDPEAEMYWFAAIQDPALPKSERQDLIDDLNEQGLTDPKHPSLDDLPLILNRLQILEAVVPSLPEGFDWQEPYDDLLNLVDVAMGGGKPVQ